ncbi:MAG: hypothetical protein ACEQR8_10535 [Cypionkella sp.]
MTGAMGKSRKRIRSAATLLALCVLQPPLAANEARPLEPALERGIADAEQRGRIMYLYDQAAWHATDRFAAQLDPQMAPNLRGYVVLPREDGLLETIFFGDFGEGLVEVARFTVVESAVTAETVHPASARPPLSALASRMARARQSALDEARKRKVKLCADAQPNTIVLPPAPDGTVEVYVLTPPMQTGRYPLGGHYRYRLGKDDKVISQHRLAQGCPTMLLPEIPKEAVGFVSTAIRHRPDPHPTEVHVFASYHRRVPLGLFTPKSGRQWMIDRGEIVAVDTVSTATVGKD